jgi:hypothetical protein
MEYFRDEKGRLVTQKQLERAANHVSPFEYLYNLWRYKRLMRSVHKQIFSALKQSEDRVYLTFDKPITGIELQDLRARLKYEGYTIEEGHIFHTVIVLH